MIHKLLIMSAFISTITLTGLTQAQQEPHHGGFDRSTMTKVCNGKKTGQAVTAKIGERTLKGTCEPDFSANHPDTLPRGERGQHQSTAQACNGKKPGQAVSVKVNGLNIHGTCERSKHTWHM